MPGLSKFDVGGCCCDIVVRAIGCSLLGAPGLTTTVYEADGVTVHSSGTSDASGNVTVSGVSGTRRITVTGDTFFAPYDQFVALSALTVVSLTPATGYHCGCGCPNAFPGTLHIAPGLGGTVLTWTGSLWDSRGGTGTGFTLSTSCLLSIYISGVNCQNLSPFSKVCNPINIVFHTFFQNAIPCSFSAGSPYTVTA